MKDESLGICQETRRRVHTLTMAPSLLTLPWAGTGFRPRFSAAALSVRKLSMLATETVFTRHMRPVHSRADLNHRQLSLLQMLGGRNMALIFMQQAAAL
jgi:hypothetical protein